MLFESVAHKKKYLPTKNKTTAHCWISSPTETDDREPLVCRRLIDDKLPPTQTLNGRPNAPAAYYNNVRLIVTTTWAQRETRLETKAGKQAGRRWRQYQPQQQQQQPYTRHTGPTEQCSHSARWRWRQRQREEKRNRKQKKINNTCSICFVVAVLFCHFFLVRFVFAGPRPTTKDLGRVTLRPKRYGGVAVEPQPYEEIRRNRHHKNPTRPNGPVRPTQCAHSHPHFSLFSYPLWFVRSLVWFRFVRMVAR